MKVGILGFARSGKTTLFNALTGSRAEVGAFGSRDANVAVIKVPDDRVERLAEIHQPKKVTFAEFQFVDVAPAEAGGERKALDDAALTVLRNVDALACVVRAFEDEDVHHPWAAWTAARDAESLQDELLLGDLIVVERRLERLEKEHKKDNQYDLLERMKALLEEGRPLRDLDLSEQEESLISGFAFLTRKPVILVGNYGEPAIGDSNPSGLNDWAASRGIPHIDLCGRIELEVAELPEEEAQEFRDDLGLGAGSKKAFIQTAYDQLGLMSFLTAGEPEVRAWTIPKGTRAVDAAGVIHSDIKRGFIRAEVVHYDDFMAAGSMAKAKEQGHVRLEGKEYLLRDGDIVCSGSTSEAGSHGP